MAGIADVARHAGVTASVVSRVINQDPTLRVREATRQRVVAAAKELDYTPNHAARALRGSRVGALGLAVHDLGSNPVYAPLIASAQRAASRHGYVLMLADVPELARDDHSFRRIVCSAAIDGLMLLPAGVAADRTMEQALEGRLPTVVVNERSRSLPSVGLADREAMHVATDHLLELGHTDIALLRLDDHRARERSAGFTDALEARGLVAAPELIVNGGHTTDSGRRAMTALLDAGHRPTAVVAASVLAAIGAQAALQQRGWRVPDDVSVIGCQDVEFASYLTPSLTVVRLPLEELGEAAVEHLLATIDGSRPGHRVVGGTCPQLLIRGSTAPATTTSPAHVPAWSGRTLGSSPVPVDTSG